MIVVFSNSYDMPTIEPVYRKLLSKDEDVLLYLADHVTSGKVQQSLTLNRDGGLLFHYGDRSFSPEDIKAAWCRRPDVFVEDEPKEVNIVFLNRQRKECQDSLIYSVPESAWLNSPSCMQPIHHDKIRQMRIAHKFGFAIPRTVIGNNWEDTFDSFTDSEVIMKLPNGTLYVDGEPHFLPTTTVNKEQRKRISSSSPFPGIWQEYMPKRKEWRVTVVGKNIFAVAIYTTEKARNDWRKHQFDKKIVRFELEKLPKNLEEKCFQMLESMGLRYGAFDFIEDENGGFTFLEVNVNGQYQWLADELKLPIADAIAEQLIEIKTTS